MNKKAPAHRHRIMVATVSLIGALLTLALFVWAWQSALNEYRQRFSYDASMRSEMVADYLDKQIQELDALKRFIEGIGTIDERSFQTLVRPILDRKGVQAVEWIPAVPADKRAVLEATPGSALRITERTTADTLIPAMQRDIYYPVQFVAPLKGNEKAVGFDLGSNPKRLDAIRASLRSGKPQATPRIALEQEHGKQFGFLVFDPVYVAGTHAGFALGVYRAGEMLENSIKLSRVWLDTSLIDLTALPEDRVVTTFSSGKTLDSNASFKVDSLFFPLLSKDRPVDFAGRKWNIHSAATPSYRAECTSVSFLAILPGGLVLTLLLVLYLNSVVSNRDRAEVLVQERTGKLAEANDSLDLILNSTAEGIYGIDVQGCCTFCNRACLDILGYENHLELLGKNMHDQIHHSHPDGSPFTVEDCRVFKAFQRGEGTHVDDEHLWRKDGSSFPAEYWSFPQHKNGKIVGAVVTFFDSTERKQSQDELQRAREIAEDANRAKSEFLATMSHEIRTPMNGVIGMTGLLLESELTDEQREYAGIVKKSGDNLLSLINDILDFSKIESRKLDMEIIDFDLRVTLEDTAEMLVSRADDAGLELICRVEPDVPEYLKGDPGRLRQIITNLTGNAIKFTHKGEVVIRASLRSEQDGFVQLLFEVRDTGIGIPQTRCAAIFEPFTQADGSTTRKYGGTGLGLSICKQLVGLMGGKIGVKSVEGKGSIFWFTAKFEKQTGLETQRTASPPHADITGSRILVVEDNTTNRTLMAALLNSWGCRFETAGGGEDALILLHQALGQNDPFRVVLLDHHMPSMDGLELGRRIKGDPLLTATLMVMVTSLAQRGDVSILEQIGFSGYLPKPVRQSQLHDCIELVLGRADQTAQAPESADASQGIITRHTVAEAVHRGVRILLAEDNIINQKVAQNILGKLGYRADVVANGLEAVRALEMISYDIVLMDCQMPEMDGYEATVTIRNQQSKVQNHGVPIIAMTANAMKGDREKCLEAGMDDYLAKPVKKDELSVVLEKWLK